jgi:hypothetical protein
MGIDDALWSARCTGRIAHADSIIFFEVDVPRIAVAILEQRFIVFIALRDGAVTEGKDDHEFNLYPVPDLFKKSQQNIIDDENAVLGVVDDVRQFIRMQPKVERLQYGSTNGTAKYASRWA